MVLLLLSLIVLLFFVWVILITMLYGVFIQLLVSSGGIKKLVETSEKFVKTKRDSLIMTFILSIVFFIDDYLNALTVGNTMRPITDRFHVSREKLAMLISLICIPIAIIIPISTLDYILWRAINDN